MSPEPGATPDLTHGLPGPAEPQPPAPHPDDVIDDLDVHAYSDDPDVEDTFGAEETLPEGYDHHDGLEEPDPEG